MVTEVAILKIDPARAEAFEEMYAGVVGVLRAQKGYRSDKLMRAIERPEEYILAVEWNDMADHQAFIASEDYGKMSGPFGDFVKESGFAHFVTVAHS